MKLKFPAWLRTATKSSCLNSRPLFHIPFQILRVATKLLLRSRYRKLKASSVTQSSQLEDAQAALRTKDLEITKEALGRGMALLQERQKLILLADKSLYGWKTVLEYKHHDLADDEKDEKKIHRAESRAARAVKRSTSHTSQRQRKFLPAVQAKSPQLAASQSPNLFARVNQHQSAQRSTSSVCFACGKPGHWSAFCPSLQQFDSAQSV